MGFEAPGIDPGPTSSQGGSAVLAANDLHYSEYVYGDVSGSLLAGMPLYASVLDAGEWNQGLTVPTANTGGLVLHPAAMRRANLFSRGRLAATSMIATP